MRIYLTPTYYKMARQVVGTANNNAHDCTAEGLNPHHKTEMYYTNSLKRRLWKVKMKINLGLGTFFQVQLKSLLYIPLPRSKLKNMILQTEHLF